MLCPWCKQEFQTSHHLRKYCSTSCYWKKVNAGRRDYLKLYEQQRHTTKIPEQTKQCIVCGGSFVQPKGHLKTYCSKRCFFVVHNKQRIAYRKAWRPKNTTQRKLVAKRWRQTHRVKLQLYGLQRYWLHGGRQKQSVKRNTATYRQKAAATMRQKLTNPIFRLNHYISGQVKRCIKRYCAVGKNREKTFDLLPYGLSELKAHLESYFTPLNGFTWDNYGKVWHVDHVIPKSWFKFSSPTDVSFQQCWSLDNLRPAHATVNKMKSASFSGDVSQVLPQDILIKNMPPDVFAQLPEHCWLQTEKVKD